MDEINIWAVLAAALSSFLLGGLWYSPVLFGNVWNRHAGSDPKKAGGRHPAIVFGTAFVLALVAAAVFAMVLGKDPPLQAAVKLGVVVGAGFVATSFGINYAFASRTLVLWLIDAGYHVLQFTLFGVILGLWH
jgi:Protein of unknown function (DUF1761)